MPETPLPQTIYLLVRGNPIDGLTYEVFDDTAEAVRWGETTGQDWWIKDLTRGEIGWD